jgi:hypothetical protein
MFLTPFCLDIGVSVGLCMSCQGCRADQASIFQSAMFVCSRIPQNKLTHRFEAPGDRATRPYALWTGYTPRPDGVSAVASPAAAGRPARSRTPVPAQRPESWTEYFWVFLNIQTSLTEILKLGPLYNLDKTYTSPPIPQYLSKMVSKT